MYVCIMYVSVHTYPVHRISVVADLLTQNPPNKLPNLFFFFFFSLPVNGHNNVGNNTLL